MYLEYATRVTEAVETAVSPLSIQLQQAMPQMVTEMDNLRGVLSTDFRNLGSELRGEMEGIRDDVGNLHTRVDKGIEKQSAKTRQVSSVLQSLQGVLEVLVKGVFETRLRLPDEPESGPAFGTSSGGLESGVQRSSTPPASTSASQPLHDGLSNTPPTNGSSHPPTGSAPVAPLSGLQVLAPLLNAAAMAARGYDREGSEETSGHQPATRTGHTLSVPTTFILETNHTTVIELWNEWHHGVAGRPSIVDMIKAKLQKSERQRKLFARRKIIIDEIKTLAKARVVSEVEIIGRLDAYRATNKLSITKLQDEIKNKKANGEMLV
jgi:hypothetical protein